MRYSAPLLTLLALGLMSACGGGGSSSGGQTQTTTASALVYTNPAATTGYSLVQDASSTSTHLVLDLVGPSGAQTMGVAFYLAVDSSKAAWSAASGSYVTPSGFLNLGSAPQMLASKVTQGSLQAGLFQKAPTAPVTFGTSNSLLSVALDLQNGVTPGTVTFVVQNGKTPVSLGAGGLSPITINVGTLAAQ